MHLDHIERPQHFGHEQLPLHPRHFPSNAGPWAKTEGMKALPIIVHKRRIIQRMVGGEPALWPVVQWIVEEARTAGQRENAGLYMGLSDACKHWINGDAAEVRQVNETGSLLLLGHNAHR